MECYKHLTDHKHYFYKEHFIKTSMENRSAPTQKWRFFCLSHLAGTWSPPGHEAELVLFLFLKNNQQIWVLEVSIKHTSSSAICTVYLSDIIQLKTFQAGLNNILTVVLITKIFTDRILQTKFSSHTDRGEGGVIWILILHWTKMLFNVLHRFIKIRIWYSSPHSCYWI